MGSQSYTDKRAFDLFAAIECLPEYAIDKPADLRMTGTDDADGRPTTHCIANRIQNRTQKPAGACKNLRNHAVYAGVSNTATTPAAPTTGERKTLENKGSLHDSGEKQGLPGTGVEPARVINS